MARTITRQTLNLFGGSGASTSFGKFGSQKAGSPVTTKAIPTIQALDAYANGWQDAVALGNAPYLEDMNALFYLLCYEQCYAFQEGVPEWDAGTAYFTGSLVKSVANAGYTEFYVSLTDANLNNALPTRADNTDWQFLCARSATGLIVPGLVGTGTNDAATAGNVGEYIESSLGSNAPVSASGSDQWFDVTSIALTAGDWLVSGFVGWTLNAAVCTIVEGGISVVSGNTAPWTVFGVKNAVSPGDVRVSGFPPTAACDSSIAMPTVRKSLSGNTTVYLKALGTYSSGTPKTYGYLSARRFR